MYILGPLILSSVVQAKVFDKEELDGLIDQLEESYKDVDEEDPTLLGQLEGVRDDLSNDIENFASRIDSFFVNESVVYGRNTTNIRVFNNLTWVEGEGVSGGLDFKVRLQLPRLKDKIQFEFDRQFDDYGVDGSSSSTTQNTFISQSSQERNTRAGFSIFGDAFKVKSKLTAGLEYQDGPNPYGNFRLSRDFKINHDQKFTAIANFYIEVADKTRQLNSLYYDIALKTNVLFRVLNESTYKDIDHTFQTLHALILFHEINDRNSTSYTAGLRGFNPYLQSTYYASEYFVTTTLRHRLYKRFLFVEGSPSIVFPKIKDFDTVYQFTVRLEVIFGKI